MQIRFGIGFDAHRLKKGRKLIIGGVEIPFEKGLDGHSDADVLCHAIGDALLGAAGLGDLGMHFPDTSAKWKDISSLLLLKYIRGLLTREKWKIQYVDSIIIAQKPRVSSYFKKMKKNISSALGLCPERISVKATTTEGMGFTGSGQGMASQAVSTLKKV